MEPVPIPLWPSTCHGLAGASSRQAGHWCHPRLPGAPWPSRLIPQGLGRIHSLSLWPVSQGTRMGQRLPPSPEAS